MANLCGCLSLKVLPMMPTEPCKHSVPWAALNRLPGLHQELRKAIMKDAPNPSEDFAEELLSRLTALLVRVEDEEELLADLRLGDPHPHGKLHLAAYAALKQHHREEDDVLRIEKCVRTLRLMGVVNQVIEHGKEVLLHMYPPKVYFGDHRRGNTNFKRQSSLDREGRPMYKAENSPDPSKGFLVWHQGKYGGYWSAYTDEAGKEVSGTFAKWAPLPFDAGGRWVSSPDEGTEMRDIKGDDGLFLQMSVGGMTREADSKSVCQSHTSAAYSSNRSSFSVEAQCTGELWHPPPVELVGEPIRDTAKMLLSLPKKVLRPAMYILYALERGAHLLVGDNGHKPSPPPPSLNSDEVLEEEDEGSSPPVSSGASVVFDWLFRLLESIAWHVVALGIPNAVSLEAMLERELPGFPFELSWVQLMILNCRFFGLSRLRHPSWPIAIIMLHDFIFRVWLRPRTSICDGRPMLRLVRYLDLERRTLVERELPPKPAGHLRFVFISDTHAWTPMLPEGAGAVASEEIDCGTSSYSRILLPEGDVLLHGGDLLNEAVGLENQQIDDPPTLRESKLVLELENLGSLGVSRDENGKQRQSRGLNLGQDMGKFKWVFFVGGNHDAPLHMLAGLGKLRPLLDDSLVLLQTPAEFEQPIPLDKYVPAMVKSTAKYPRVEAAIVQGAVRILPDGTLCEPHRCTDLGVVIAGSGMSLANNAWSANRAFQVQRSAADELRWAASQLMKHSPDVVITHGPPRGYNDEGRGDEHLRAALDEADCSAKLHLFGHAHTNGMSFDNRPWEMHGRTYPGRCFVNGSICTRLYLPTRLPIVFDLPAAQRSTTKL